MSAINTTSSGSTHTTLGKRIKAAGRELVNDPDLQAGIAQVVMALAALAVRAFTSKSPSSGSPT